MGKKTGDRDARDVERVLRVLQSGAATAADALAAWSPANPAAVAKRTEAADRAWAKQVRRYDRSVERLRTRVAVGAVAVPGFAALAVVTAPVLAVGSVVGAAVAATAWTRLRHVTPPVRPALPPPPLPALRRSDTGADEIARLDRARRQLAVVGPAVERLHPDAAKELRGAVDEAEPALLAQAQRLAVLAAVAREMSATEAGAAAATSARDVAVRMGRGVTAYERLLAAAATMLGAPDLDRSAEEVLAPAIDGLLAYAHGLAAHSDDGAASA